MLFNFKNFSRSGLKFLEIEVYVQPIAIGVGFALSPNDEIKSINFFENNDRKPIAQFLIGLDSLIR
jgi:hypothetical protein